MPQAITKPPRPMAACSSQSTPATKNKAGGGCTKKASNASSAKPSPANTSKNCSTNSTHCCPNGRLGRSNNDYANKKGLTQRRKGAKQKNSTTANHANRRK